MSALAALFRVPVAIYRLIAASWNACLVLLQVIRTVMQEAKQEAAELMALLEDGTPVTEVITSTSALLGAEADMDMGVRVDLDSPANPWPMLIVARPSSFVLLLRLSKRRVLHLEVDERFVAGGLRVIRSELALRVEHVPWLLQTPIGMYDTQLVPYAPMRLPYLWKEEHATSRSGSGLGLEETVRAVVPAASCISAGGEERAHRKKYVQLLTESALRRQLHMDRLERAGTDAAPKRGPGSSGAKESAGKRKVLANATNVGAVLCADGEGSVTDVDGPVDGPYGPGVAETPKQVRMERSIRAALSENMSIPNLAQAVPASRKVVESVPVPRRTTGGPQSLRRRRGQYDLYAQGVAGEFSLLPKTGQGRD